MGIVVGRVFSKWVKSLAPLQKSVKNHRINQFKTSFSKTGDFLKVTPYPFGDIV